MRSIRYVVAVLSACALLDSACAQAAENGAKDDKRQATGSQTQSATAVTTASASDPTKSPNAGDNNASEGATLSPELIAKASKSDGNPTNGQAPSLTDNFNFINFCKGQQITNGEQNLAGSCNPIPMGQIPAKANMISTILTNPKNGETLKANEAFTIELQTNNLVAGQFTNPNNTYYAAPQHLQDGKIIGHVHVTVQDMGDNLVPADPTKFAFFKGIDDAGDGKGKLSTTVTSGVPAGNYRLCTLVAAANHQPVMMPVAQRGAQDDCIRFTVTAAGGAASPPSTTTAAAAGASATTSAVKARRVRRARRM